MYTYKHMYILVSNAIVDSLQTRRQDGRVRAEAEGPQQRRGLHEGYYRAHHQNRVLGPCIVY